MPELTSKLPEDREYTASHEWVRLDGTTATIGVTSLDPANSGALNKVEIVAAGTALKTGDRAATFATSLGQRDVLAPLSGSVVEVNADLQSNPQLLQSDPFERGWLFRMRVEAGEEIEHLLEPSVYAGRQSTSDPDI